MSHFFYKNLLSNHEWQENLSKFKTHAGSIEDIFWKLDCGIKFVLKF